jgi:hypothetical protein
MTIVNKAGAHPTSQAASTEPPTGNGQSSWSGPVSVHSLLDQREKTHGDFRYVAVVAQTLRHTFRSSGNWAALSRDKQEALDMIASKIGRVLAGDPDCKDHWEDIAGYATLVARSL